jgi:acyl-CoA synthetase (AMP-forming)/AMP-acid ligase II
MNVIGPVFHFGRTRQDAPALVEGERTITYGDLTGLVRRTACHLVVRGFGRGDRIGLCLKDTADHVVALLAVAYMGAVAVPLDWRARPAENARYIDALGLTCVLVEADARLADDRAVVLDAEWHRAVAQADAGAQPSFDSACDRDDPFLISATSGSTGVPKFTLMTHLQYYFAAAGMIELMGLAGRHRFLCALPLYYSAGRNSCLAHLLRGDCVVLYPSLFNPAEYIEVVNRQRITTAAVVPSMVRLLLTVAWLDGDVL